MFDIPHEKLTYTFQSASDRLDITPKVLTELVSKHRIRTFRVKGKPFIPNFELDRLIVQLMRQEVQREFMEQAKDTKQPKVNHHGTG